jgi:hypothetical protein
MNVPGTYRKVVASQVSGRVLGSSTSATNSALVSSRKAENKYAGGNLVYVCPTPKLPEKLGTSPGCPLKILKKDTWVPEVAGSSGLGKAKRKACPLQHR